MNTPVPLFIGLFAALGLAYWFSRHMSRAIVPCEVDHTWSPVATFYRHRAADPSGDVELGGAWTSALDPGAGFRLSWISETGELVALRHQAKAGLHYNPLGIFGLGNVPTMNRRAEGMKVLADATLPEVRAAATPALAATPDGLDRLTAALGRPYRPPVGAADVAAELATGGSARVAHHHTRRPEDVERHEHLVAAIPSIAAVVGVVAIAVALIFGSSSIGAAAVPALVALGVLVVAAALATTAGNFTFSKILLRRTHRDHDEQRRNRTDSGRRGR